jgi:hypothetical protein
MKTSRGGGDNAAGEAIKVEIKVESGSASASKPPLPTSGVKRKRSTRGGNEEATIQQKGAFTPIVGSGIAAGAKRSAGSGSGGRGKSRGTISFRSASPNSINIASALSLLSGVRCSPVLVKTEKRRRSGDMLEASTSSESEGHTSPVSSDNSLGRKDSLDESTTSSSASDMSQSDPHERKGGPWLEIVGVAVADR